MLLETTDRSALPYKYRRVTTFGALFAACPTRPLQYDNRQAGIRPRTVMDAAAMAISCTVVLNNRHYPWQRRVLLIAFGAISGAEATVASNEPGIHVATTFGFAFRRPHRRD